MIARILEYQSSELGLARGAVKLVPHSSRWKRHFSDEAYFIFDQLRDESLRLYHCGSTSVPGLDAKPIIDIVGSVSSIETLDKNCHRLESIGYEYKGEYGIAGRRYCVLYNPEKTIAFIHLHIFEHGSSDVERHLAFRDHLRISQRAREEYSREKSKIIQSNILRSEYSNAKAPIILKLETEAMSRTSTSNVLAVLGAADGHQKTNNFLVDSFKRQNLEVNDLSRSSVSGFSYSKMANDDFISTIQKVSKADLLVLATPVYWYAMSGPMKDFMDRFSNLMNGPHKALGESLCGKRIRVLATGYDLTPPLGFEVPFSATAIYFGMDYMGCDYKSTR
jgi:GrpB-like predicted nucleotidyltransferase (UPF0157 family)